MAGMASADEDLDRIEGAHDRMAMRPTRLVSLPHADSWTSWRVQRQAKPRQAEGPAPDATAAPARSRMPYLLALLLASLAIAMLGRIVLQAPHVRTALACDPTLMASECQGYQTRLKEAAGGEARAALLAQYARGVRERARTSPDGAGRVEGVKITPIAARLPDKDKGGIY